MKNSAKAAACSWRGPRSSSTSPGSRKTADSACALRMRCERPKTYSSTARATSTQPISGRGVDVVESSMRVHERQISHAQMARTIGPWLCSSVDQMLRARSTTVGT